MNNKKKKVTEGWSSVSEIYTITMINSYIFCFEIYVDRDQLSSDQEPHCSLLSSDIASVRDIAPCI